VRNATLADDLVQQTFLNMHCARATFRAGADVVPWAFAIGHRLLVDEVRRGRPRGVTMAFPASEEDHGGPFHATDRATPEGIALSRQLARRLDEELARLPEGQRVAFELVRLDGLSMAEAAAVGERREAPGAQGLRGAACGAGVGRGLSNRVGPSNLNGREPSPP
jgi:RNA polymerase sigma-70 factor (ECF subfamily)